jgi:hypothetical protein
MRWLIGELRVESYGPVRNVIRNSSVLRFDPTRRSHLQ